MEGVTLAVAIITSVIVLSLRPIWGLVVYVGALIWYPSYLSVQVGTFDFTVCRVVILALYANVLLRTKLAQRFKLIWLDRLVII